MYTRYGYFSAVRGNDFERWSSHTKWQHSGAFFADGVATPTLAGGVFTILIPHYMTEKLVQRYIRVAHFSVILAGDAVRGLPLYKPGICLQGGHAHCDTRHDMRPDR